GRDTHRPKPPATAPCPPPPTPKPPAAASPRTADQRPSLPIPGFRRTRVGPVLDPVGCRGGASAEENMQPDGCALVSGPDLDQVAQFVGASQAVAAVL